MNLKITNIRYQFAYIEFANKIMNSISEKMKTKIEGRIEYVENKVKSVKATSKSLPISTDYSSNKVISDAEVSIEIHKHLNNRTYSQFTNLNKKNKELYAIILMGYTKWTYIIVQ